MSDPGALDALERALATVIDPELHKPMLQLGMLRDLAIDGGVASVRVVLTTPACPLKDRIQADIDEPRSSASFQASLAWRSLGMPT